MDRMKLNIFKKIWFIPLVAAFCICLYVLLLPGSPLSKTEMGHLFSTFRNMNSFSLDLSEDLNKKKIRIEWNGDTVFDGYKFLRKNIDKNRFIYGENTFRIKYDNQLINQFVQYKYNDWHYHKYKISIMSKDKKVKSLLEIIGSDSYFY